MLKSVNETNDSPVNECLVDYRLTIGLYESVFNCIPTLQVTSLLRKHIERYLSLKRTFVMSTVNIYGDEIIYIYYNVHRIIKVAKFRVKRVAVLSERSEQRFRWVCQKFLIIIVRQLTSFISLLVITR
jgi:hypothetical protein